MIQQHLSYETCLKLKELGIDQTLYVDDFYYDKIKILYINLYNDKNKRDLSEGNYIKIPSEQDLRDWMNPLEYYFFKNYLEQQFSFDTQNELLLQCQHQKDNYLQLMVDWIIKEKEK